MTSAEIREEFGLTPQQSARALVLWDSVDGNYWDFIKYWQSKPWGEPAWIAKEAYEFAKYAQDNADLFY